jgi:hypothetical protein
MLHRNSSMGSQSLQHTQSKQSNAKIQIKQSDETVNSILQQAIEGPNRDGSVLTYPSIIDRKVEE